MINATEGGAKSDEDLRTRARKSRAGSLARGSFFAHHLSMSKRSKMILSGVVPIVGVAAVIIGIGLGGRLPGLAGEIFRKITGFMFTPVFLELTFALLGLIAVFWINSIRLQREGDDFVSLEIEDEQDEPRA